LATAPHRETTATTERGPPLFDGDGILTGVFVRVALARLQETWDRVGMGVILLGVLVLVAVGVGLYFAFGRG
jgi:hypothetical protein